MAISGYDRSVVGPAAYREGGAKKGEADPQSPPSGLSHGADDASHAKPRKP